MEKNITRIGGILFFCYIIDTIGVWLLIFGFVILIPVIYLRITNSHESKKSSKYSRKSFSSSYQSKRKDVSEIKGDEFERYVVDHFDEEHFTVVEWSTDTMRKHDRYVESNTNHDLLIRHNQSGDVFAVECKYRSRLYKNKFNWSTHEQMNRYLRYAQVNNIPFFVILGLGGIPQNPESVYCIPLSKAEYPELYQSVLNKYYHALGEYFFWMNGALR